MGKLALFQRTVKCYCITIAQEGQLSLGEGRVT